MAGTDIRRGSKKSILDVKIQQLAAGPDWATMQAADSDKLDGYHASNAAGDIPISNGAVNTTLNADQLDGYHASAFAAASHPHGNITSDGKVGTTADLPLFTGPNGIVVARTMTEAAQVYQYTTPNILHNWDFRNPVNQRRVSGVISTAGYFYDRWLLNSGAVTTNAAYLTIGAAAVIEQRIEFNLLAGKTVTVSVDAGGTVYSGTGTMPTEAGAASVTLTGWGTATLGYATGYMYVRLSPTVASNVQAAKLELGTVSTLAYDAPADYGAELAKCRRFLNNGATGVLDSPYAIDPNNVYYHQPTSLDFMRYGVTPTVISCTVTIAYNWSGYPGFVGSLVMYGSPVTIYTLTASKTSHGMSVANGIFATFYYLISAEL